MVVVILKWFHQVMGHPGEKRLQETLNQHYYHPRLRYHIDKLKCKDCQKHRLAGHGYGPLPEQEVQIAPWEEGHHQIDWAMESQSQWSTS
jgi:hypothetical protein